MTIYSYYNMTNNNDHMVLGIETREYPIYLGSKLFKTVRLNIEGPKDELDAYKDYPFESFTEGNLTYHIDKHGCVDYVKIGERSMTQEDYWKALYGIEFKPYKSPRQMVQENYDAILATIKRLERLEAFEDLRKLFK